MSLNVGMSLSNVQSSGSSQNSLEMNKICQWILELNHPDTRENALLELRYSEVKGIEFTFKKIY